MQTGLNNGVGDWRSHIFFFWLGIVGTVGSLIGIVLSFYFYQESQIKPLLTFSVHPLKTELQRPDFDKELGFIYKGKPVNSESITSAAAIGRLDGQGRQLDLRSPEAFK